MFYAKICFGLISAKHIVLRLELGYVGKCLQTCFFISTLFNTWLARSTASTEIFWDFSALWLLSEIPQTSIVSKQYYVIATKKW